MPHFNPLAERSDSDPEDVALVARVQAGNRQALETLLARHQPWIYNILVRMLYHPAEAEDATEEVLIKVLTKLSTFEGRSSFRTWLYRIVLNHALNIKRRTPRSAYLHAWAMRPRQPRQPMPVREENSRVHTGRLS